MPTKKDEPTDLSDREILTTRLFDAPREIVFMAWTAPEYIARWWGPKGFTCTFHEIDVRPGGRWDLTMHGPDGVDYPSELRFVEITHPSRIVLNHVKAPLFQITADFEDVGGKTKLTFRQLFETPETFNKVKGYATEGNREMFDRLGDELTRLTTINEVSFVRVFDAPRQLVFKMWTDQEKMARWWGPKGFTNPLCKLDVRPGGAIRIDMRGPDGSVHPMKGVFTKISTPELIEFTATAFEDENGVPLVEVRHMVSFDEKDGLTTLTVRSTAIKTGRPKLLTPLAGMEAGWSQSLDKLSAEVQKTGK